MHVITAPPLQCVLFKCQNVAQHVHCNHTLPWSEATVVAPCLTYSTRWMDSIQLLAVQAEEHIVHTPLKQKSNVHQGPTVGNAETWFTGNAGSQFSIGALNLVTWDKIHRTRGLIVEHNTEIHFAIICSVAFVCYKWNCVEISPSCKKKNTICSFKLSEGVNSRLSAD